VQALDLARMVFKCARVGGDLGSVLVLHDMQFERVSFADASGVSGNGCSACLHVVDYMVFYVEG
jgi:hypothetical protein